MADFIDWPGPNGTAFRYWFLPNPFTSGGVLSASGNYMFVRLANDGWHPEYIGIADDLAARLLQHDRWAEAAALGCTKVMAHTHTNQAARDAEEKALIGHWQPRLNVQHRGLGKAGGGLGS